MRIGGKSERVIGAIERPFDVAQYCVEPAHATGLGCVTATATVAFDDGVRVTHVDHRAKGTQPIA